MRQSVVDTNLLTIDAFLGICVGWSFSFGPAILLELPDLSCCSPSKAKFKRKSKIYWEHFFAKADDTLSESVDIKDLSVFCFLAGNVLFLPISFVFWDILIEEKRLFNVSWVRVVLDRQVLCHNRLVHSSF